MTKNELKICPHDEFCGGCIYQGVPYEEQLRSKEREVRTLLEKNGVCPEVIDPIEGCPSQYAYRNKMEYTFGDLVKDGETTLGMHMKGKFMSIITVDQCQLVHQDFNKILRATLDFVIERGYPKYNKKTHAGLMRNLVIRRGVNTGEILVNIVTASDEKAGMVFDNGAYVDVIRNLELQNNLVGVLRTECDTLADAVIPDRLVTLWGRDHYNEELLGLKFKVSAFSFFQTNVEAVTRLYSEALALIPDIEGKRVFDLYCGTGTISQIMALKAAKVLGVEIVEEAVLAARENAALNGLDNCEFFAGDVYKVLEGEDFEKPDVIVVDPPRAGIQPKALDKIISYGVDEILYISCGPKTLCQNLAYLEDHGYHAVYLKTFDNFPFTKHTECIALISKKL
ncbi:MAG: 23S rRNA (uracil(1939)-C(5))-methyltransferase RlmD [Firmicutes bacterium]|nr:23S rRNA (uracil(1939)-C(5))-methyltransferase RlmD [Bacillota bacterium]